MLNQNYSGQPPRPSYQQQQQRNGYQQRQYPPRPSYQRPQFQQRPPQRAYLLEEGQDPPIEDFPTEDIYDQTYNEQSSTLFEYENNYYATSDEQFPDMSFDQHSSDYDNGYEADPNNDYQDVMYINNDNDPNVDNNYYDAFNITINHIETLLIHYNDLIEHSVEQHKPSKILQLGPDQPKKSPTAQLPGNNMIYNFGSLSKLSINVIPDSGADGFSQLPNTGFLDSKSFNVLKSDVNSKVSKSNLILNFNTANGPLRVSDPDVLELILYIDSFDIKRHLMVNVIELTSLSANTLLLTFKQIMELDLLQIHTDPVAYKKKYGPHKEPEAPEELSEKVKGLFPTKYDCDSDEDVEDIGEVSAEGIFKAYTNINSSPPSVMHTQTLPPLEDSDSEDDDAFANVFTATQPKGGKKADSQAST